MREFEQSFTHLEEMLDYCQSLCEQKKLSMKEQNNIRLVIEELLSFILEKKEQEGSIKISLVNRFGDYSIRIASKGEAFNPIEELENEQDDEDEIDVIRKMILKAHMDRLSYARKGNQNLLLISIRHATNKMLYATLGAMLLSVVVGVLFNIMGDNPVTAALDTYVFISIRTMYLNALKLIVVPVVFFSMVSCISGLSDLSELGRIAGKTMGVYMMTTVIAIAVGVVLSYVFHLGEGTSIDLSSLVYEGATEVSQVSLKDIIVGIIPSNLINPIQNIDMLQVIFVAVLTGVAVGKIGEHSKILIDLFQACEKLFLKMTIIIVGATPVAAFCAMTDMIMNIGVDILLPILKFVMAFAVGLIVMIFIYCLLMFVFVKENPKYFLKKLMGFIVTPFILGSSNAVMPQTLEFCTNKIGISPKVSSFSIALGATVNMDGTSIYLGMTTLFIAKLYGIDFTPNMLFTLAISILILSVGAPGVPGGGLICMSLILSQFDIPIEAIGLMVGLDRLFGMMRTVSNVTGDIAASMIVAKSEGMFDEKVYRGE